MLVPKDVDPADFPVDAVPVSSGSYMRFEGRWYPYSLGREFVVLYSLGEVVPEGFAARSGAGGEWVDRTGFRRIGLDEAGPIVKVSSLCVWKGLVWWVRQVSRSGDVWRLEWVDVLPKEEAPPVPDRQVGWHGLFREWPGVDWVDREHVSALVRPAEVARWRMTVTEWAGPVAGTGRRASWWRGSLVWSPFVTAERAVELVREYVAREGLRLGEYSLDALEVERLRDGWRVWSRPPVVEGPGDLRFGWAVFYVADDGVVVRSSTSQSVSEAAQSVSNGLFRRLQGAARISDGGPVEPAVERGEAPGSLLSRGEVERHLGV